MKKLILLISFLLVIFTMSSNIYKLNRQDIFLADPTIFYENKKYYLYGTSAGGIDSTNIGLKVYLSDDLKKWEFKGYALKNATPYGDKGFWAPQILKKDSLYYMFYTVNEKISVACSKSPLGPFKPRKKKYIQTKHRQIDPFVFADSNKYYLYHVRRLHNDNVIFVAELKNDFNNINDETLTMCLSSDLPWENEDDFEFKSVQGPSVFKIDSTYYMLYSANNFKSSNYAVGYAISSNPLGPWIKSIKNPLINFKTINESGSGHGDIFHDKMKNNFKYVLHTHNSFAKMRPRKTGILDLIIDKKLKTINLKSESFKFLKSQNNN